MPADQPELGHFGRDPAAFARFYEAHFEAVLGFVTRRVGDPHTAADLTAEVFLAVVQSADSYQPGRGTPVAWLFGIARKVIAGQARRAGSESRAVSQFGGQRQIGHDDIVALEERIDAHRAIRELGRRLDALPEPSRAVLELVAVDGLTVTQAATALGIRPITARVRLHRARRLLQQPTGTESININYALEVRS